MNDNAAKSVRVAFSEGKRQYQEYVDSRLICGEISIYAVIKRNKFPLLRQRNTLSTSKVKLKTTSLKQDCKLFAPLYVACQSREGDIADFFSHENHSHPPSISEYGKLRKGSKADFLQILANHGSTELECSPVTSKVMDGAALVQMSKPGDSKSFGQYASKVFVDRVLRTINKDNVERVDVVFDRYFKQSLKSETRDKRGDGIRISVRETTPVPKDWGRFLRVDENKEELFTLLAKELAKQISSSQVIVATTSDTVVSNMPIDRGSLSPCNHEEADTRILLHVKHAAQNNHTRICIQTVDTNVVVIAVSIFNQLGIEQIWIEFGTGKDKRWLPVHEYAASLGEEICSGL